MSEKNIEIEGADELIENLKKVYEKSKVVCRKLMTDIGYDLLQKSRAIVPIDTGTLASDSDAGFISDDELIVTYGMGPARDYAVVQHERLDFRHAPGREAKYLEKPFRENVNRYIEIISKFLERIK